MSEAHNDLSRHNGHAPYTRLLGRQPRGCGLEQPTEMDLGTLSAELHDDEMTKRLKRKSEAFKAFVDVVTHQRQRLPATT